jgi:hypothetical protein
MAKKRGTTRKTDKTRAKEGGLWKGLAEAFSALAKERWRVARALKDGEELVGDGERLLALRGKDAAEMLSRAEQTLAPLAAKAEVLAGESSRLAGEGARLLSSANALMPAADALLSAAVLTMGFRGATSIVQEASGAMRGARELFPKLHTLLDAAGRQVEKAENFTPEQMEPMLEKVAGMTKTAGLLTMFRKMPL